MRDPRLALAVALALVLAVFLTAPASAQTVRVIVDGSSVIFDQPPIAAGGRVLIPLRGVFEQLRAYVQWNPANNPVLAARGGTEVSLTIGSRIAFVNGSQVARDVTALASSPMYVIGSAGATLAIQPSVRIPNATLTITARAIDPLGRQATPATVQVTQR